MDEWIVCEWIRCFRFRCRDDLRCNALEWWWCVRWALPTICALLRRAFYWREAIMVRRIGYWRVIPILLRLHSSACILRLLLRRTFKLDLACGLRNSCQKKDRFCSNRRIRVPCATVAVPFMWRRASPWLRCADRRWNWGRFVMFRSQFKSLCEQRI